jgi:hypothetical protein
MRLASLKFATRNDSIIELRNQEDWVVQVYINGDDQGSVICPGGSRSKNPVARWALWAALIINRVKEFTSNLEEHEEEQLKEYLVELLKFIA